MASVTGWDRWRQARGIVIMAVLLAAGLGLLGGCKSAPVAPDTVPAAETTPEREDGRWVDDDGRELDPSKVGSDQENWEPRSTRRTGAEQRSW